MKGGSIKEREEKRKVENKAKKKTKGSFQNMEEEKEIGRSRCERKRKRGNNGCVGDEYWKCNIKKKLK